MPGESTQTVVPSQPPATDPAGESPPAAATPPAPDPETRKHNWDGATRRLQSKNWNEIRKKEMEEAAKQALKEAGFDSDDKDNDKHAQVITKIFTKGEEIRTRIDNQSRTEAASSALASSFKDLGYDPSSPEARLLGNHLFQKFGVDNPAMFSDAKVVEQEIEAIASSISRKKKADDPVTRALVSKTAPQRTTESRTTAPDVGNQAKVKDKAARMGVSVEVAQMILENESKLPEHFRRKN